MNSLASPTTTMLAFAPDTPAFAAAVAPAGVTASIPAVSRAASAAGSPCWTSPAMVKPRPRLVCNCRVSPPDRNALRFSTAAASSGSRPSRSNSSRKIRTTSAALSFLVWVEAVSNPSSARAVTLLYAP